MLLELDSSRYYSVYMCFTDFETYRCIRTSILDGLCLITLIMCIVEVLRLVKYKKHKVSFHLVILYIAILEMLVGVLHYTYFIPSYWDMVINYLKLVQYLIIVLFYAKITLSVFERERMLYRVVVPGILCFFLYLTVLFIISAMQLIPISSQCTDLTFLLFSTSECVFGIVLCVMATLSFRELEQKLMRSLTEKAKPLFKLMLVYTTTSTIAMIFTLYVYTQLRSYEKCVDFFNFIELRFFAIFILTRTVDIMLPIWAIVHLFFRKSPMVAEGVHIQATSDTDTMNLRFRAMSAAHYKSSVLVDL